MIGSDHSLRRLFMLVLFVNNYCHRRNLVRKTHAIDCNDKKEYCGESQVLKLINPIRNVLVCNKSKKSRESHKSIVLLLL